MPPLTRQDTLPSIHSWWSDSNSALAHSPTINLHAAAKPLMKLMYHRQALALIKKNRGKPLSGTTLEIYTSYFQWDFVWWSTKAAIFEDLAVRAESNVDEARAVVDSPDFYYIMQMLKSPDFGARISSCGLLGSLAMHECTAEAILELGTCAQLVSLLSNEGPLVIEWAVYALSRIACSSDGVQAIVDAGALGHVPKLLESPRSNIRERTCFLMGNLAYHESTRAAVVALKPVKTLVTLLRDEDSGVVEGAVFTLSNIASLDGAQAIVDAGALGHVSELLKSSSPNIQKWTCFLMGNLAQHESTRAAVVVLKPYETLVTLLRNEDSGVVEGATHALSRIAGLILDGARAIVDAGALNHVSTFLESPNPKIQKWTCILMGNLAFHESTRAAVVALKPVETLVTLLRDEDSSVIEGAAHALSQIALSIDGTRAIVDAGALNHVLGLLQSPSLGTREHTCMLVGNLASHESTTAAVLTLKPYKLLVSLLGDEDSEVIGWAVYALSHIARSFEGAQAVLNAGALNRFFTLIESPSFDIRKWTCVLVGALASHHKTSTIAPAGLELKPYERLASFFQHSPTITRASATFALCAISEWPDGVAALADPDIVQELHELSHSLAITCLDDELSLEYLHTTMENITRYMDGTGIVL